MRDYGALFAELSQFRDQQVQSLGLLGYEFNKIPKFLSESGERLTIESESSVVIRDYQAAIGLKAVLTKHLSGFHLVKNGDFGFRYPTAALANLGAPYIKRFRSEYFHKTDESRYICRPMNLSYGIKSRGKDVHREEYEVWVPQSSVTEDPTHLFVDKYGEDLPHSVRVFAAKPPLVHGWMGVKRCAFEGIYVNQQAFGDLVICVALSLDAYNIGARPDLSFSDYAESSIATSNAEIEWEVTGYYAPSGYYVSQDHIWAAINTTINTIGAAVEQHYADDIIPCEHSKTERILMTIGEMGVSEQEIIELDLKPWEFLQTHSPTRRKQHDPKRSVNLLGRLNRLFYHEEKRLPSLGYLHHLVAKTL
jgi:hypothetical protein